MNYATQFLTAHAASERTGVALDDAERKRLGDALDNILREAKTKWPSIALCESRFLTYLAERTAASTDLVQQLGSLHAVDLYLCCACVDGNERAILHLQEAYFPGIERALARTGVDPTRRKEVQGELIAHLFVADGRSPRIASYRGTGPLQGWLRAVAVRRALATTPEAVQEDRALANQPGTLDLEAQYLKAQYGPLFESAFAAALRSLSPHQRNLLRRYLLDGLRIDDLAVIHRVHRATVARWIERAREDLAQRVYERLAKQLGLPQGELRSLLRAIHSQINISLGKLLR
jgi:RNA polymerase sigma-70 factor (ECF subfamily)